MTRYRLMLITSMTIFGTLAPFVRNIAVSSGELALYRAVMAAVLIGAFLLLTRQSVRFGEIKKALPLLLVSGAAMGVNWILLFEAYKYTTVAISTLSYYFAPVIVTVACPLLFKEKLTKKQILCFLMSTVGLVFVIGVTGPGNGSNNLLGIAFGLGAACFYATVILLNKLIRDISGLYRTLLQLLAAIVVLLPYVACSSGCSLEALDSTGWICLLVVGLIHTGFAYCLYFSALKPLPGKTFILTISFILCFVNSDPSKTQHGSPLFKFF